MTDRHLDTTDLSLDLEVGLDEAAMIGRPGYRSGVRPNHQMPGRDYTFIGQLNFLDREWLRPGETCRAHGEFVVAAQDRDRFVPGFTWLFGEAGRMVGYCKVTRE